MEQEEVVSAEEGQTAKTILIVEDDVDIGDFLVIALTSEGEYHCLLAPDAFQALERVKTLVPDLFIIDYQLPKMNGLELYDHLHEQKALSHVPVLFMSANLPNSELRKRKAPHLHKPFSLDDLLQRVNAILAHSQNATS